MDRFEEVKLRIKESINLVEVVEGYVPLRPRGRYHVGLCPFHAEKTPSFTVYGDTQHYKCFGCGKAGDLFSFLMEREGLSFRETLEMLAERSGISTEGVFGQGKSRSKDRIQSHDVLAQVRIFFAKALQGERAQPARDYLESRGLSGAIESFGLGYHLPGGSLLAFARSQNLPLAVLQQAGLLASDGRYERFAGRLMFPIEDERGRVVGFGGRVLEGKTEKAKYINSSESEFFNKRRLLFGLRQAKRAGCRQLVVMEGYTDVIAAHLAGMEGAVATLGTALTADHAHLLERYASEGVVLLFDGDRAGRQAADRAFRELVHTRLPVRVALLAEGQDPADLVADGSGSQPLQDLVDQAEDALTMWFRLMRQRLDLTLDVNVERAVVECARVLQSLEDAVRRESLATAMARHLGVEPRNFQASLRKHVKPRLVQGGKNPPKGAPEPVPGSGKGAANPAANTDSPQAQSEMDLLACLLVAPELHTQLDPELLANPHMAELFVLVKEGSLQGLLTKDRIVGYVFSRCAERSELASLLAQILDRCEHIKTPQTTLSLLKHDLGAYGARQQARKTRYLLQEARANGDTALANELTQQYIQQLRRPDVGSP